MRRSVALAAIVIAGCAKPETASSSSAVVRPVVASAVQIAARADTTRRYFACMEAMRRLGPYGRAPTVPTDAPLPTECEGMAVERER